MGTLLKLFKEYIKHYKNAKDDDKVLFARDIYIIYYIFVNDRNSFKKNYYIDNIMYLYKKLSKEKEFMDDIFFAKEKIFENSLKFIPTDEDVQFLLELINDIKISNFSRNKNDKNGFVYVRNYTRLDSDYDTLISDFNNKIVYNNSLDNSCLLRLSNKEILLINSYNCAILMHELTHKYSNISNIYSETLSIISEFGIESKYGLGDVCNRLEYMHNLKKVLVHFLQSNKISFQSDISYIVGIIIALTFVYKNGNDFKTIKLAMDTIKNNKDKSLENNLKRLNITKIDIINSFKHPSKILVYK